MSTTAEPRRVELFGVEVDAVTLGGAVEAARHIVRAGVPSQHVVLNAAKVVAIHDDPALRDVIRSCAMVNADGIAIVLAARVLGTPLPARVTGIDLFEALVGAAATDGDSIFLLGARPEVVTQVADELRRRHPGLVIAGTADGYWDDDAAVIAQVRAAAPQYLFLAVPSPRKEFWLRDHLDALGVPFVMGVGGSFDVVAGVVSRAPVLVQRLGMEWCWRLAAGAAPDVEALPRGQHEVPRAACARVVGKETSVNCVVIAGARPNFMKVAPLLRELARRAVPAELVHTGQHYDRNMSELFFEELGIGQPGANFDVRSGSHAVQTAQVMVHFEEWLDEHPAIDTVIVAGDVNSTVACALVAAKREMPVAHVEAGLRSFDRSMPEEINRIVVDALSTWLLTPSADADENLRREGVREDRIFRVGNIMVDSLFWSLDQARARSLPCGLSRDERFALVTLHRPGLVDDPARLQGVLTALGRAGTFPSCSHCTLVRLPQSTNSGSRRSSIGSSVLEPQGYLDFLALESSAALVLTDSGGVQEETTMLGVPCLTLRENTERPVTVTEGTNRVVGLDGPTILEIARRTLEQPPPARRPALWDGDAARRIVDVLEQGAPPDVWAPDRIEPDRIEPDRIEPDRIEEER